MKHAELVQKAIDKIFNDETRKNPEERRARIEALTPILGREDAEIAVALDEDIRTDGKRAIAEAGAGFIRDRLRGPSLARQIFPSTMNVFVVTPKKEV